MLQVLHLEEACRHVFDVDYDLEYLALYDFEGLDDLLCKLIKKHFYLFFFCYFAQLQLFLALHVLETEDEELLVGFVVGSLGFGILVHLHVSFVEQSLHLFDEVFRLYFTYNVILNNNNSTLEMSIFFWL